MFEASPFWEPELQRQFPDGDVRVRGCRSIEDLKSVIAHSAAPPVVVLYLGQEPSAGLHWLGRIPMATVRPVVIVVVPEQHRSLEWHLCELGALVVVDEFVGGRRLARLCLHALRTVPKSSRQEISRPS